MCIRLTEMKVLIVEDDSKTSAAVRRGLEAEGYHATIANTGTEGLDQLQQKTFDVVVLDWMLPGCDGITLLRSLRGSGSHIPVLLLTARDAVEDRVLGLDSGADDYLVKPFAFAELLARLRVLTRRSGQDDALIKRVSGLKLDMQSRQAWRDDKEITLTPREFDLLAYLMRSEGQIVTREMLAREVWRETNRSTPLDNVIDVHLARLRRKVDDSHSARLIQTIRGVGFLCGEKRTTIHR